MRKNSGQAYHQYRIRMGEVEKPPLPEVPKHINTRLDGTRVYGFEDGRQASVTWAPPIKW